jgi:hypothetical protein
MKSPRYLLLAAVAAVALAFVSGCNTLAVTSLSPSSGPPGTVVTATGSYDFNGRQIQASGPVVASSTPALTNNGAFSLTFTIKSDAHPGTYPITFTDSENPAGTTTAKFTVNAP